MALPIFKSPDEIFNLMQQQWGAVLNPFLSIPLPNGGQIVSAKLVSGSNVVNHQLGKTLTGWFIVRRRQFVVTGTPTVYDVTDTQDANSMPQLTLNLYCTQGTTANPVLVDLWVY